MSLEIGAILFDQVQKIVISAVAKKVSYEGERFLTKRKIESRLADSIARVVESLLPFFENERVSDAQRELLVNTCTEELSKLVAEPGEFFAASLNGQKVFERKYASGQFPRVIRDEGLDDLYALIFPQVANLMCIYPLAVEQWKIEGYRDEFRRLDEIAATLGSVAIKLDLLTSKEVNTADVLLTRVHQSLAQQVEFQLDLTGLRGDRPDAVPLEKCFVVPEFERRMLDSKPQIIEKMAIGTDAQILTVFGRQSVRRLVIGPPGSGKSTWSRWLQKLNLTSNEVRLPVLIRLRDIVKRDQLPSHHELVRESAGIHLREEIDPAAVREWCNCGKVTFILDGFDEIPPTKRDSLMSWIRELGIAIDNAGLVITSRPLTTSHLDNIAGPWERWELLPFDESRITDYISRWYANAPLLVEKPRNVDAAELAARWFHDPVLHPLVGNPLMLATILMVHHMDGELPGGRAKLYERYINGMLGLWDSRWGVTSSIDLSPELKKRILTRLALHLHLAEIEQLSDAEIEDLLQSIMPSLGCSHSAAAVLGHLGERTGLLIGPGTWGFVHKNVGEFLVAAAIQDGDQIDSCGQRMDRLRLFSERLNDRWNVVLFFWAGLTTPGDLQSFIEQIAAETEDEDLFLAINLISDQSQPYRLTESWRSDQLLKLLKRGLKRPETGSLIIGSLPREFVVELPFPIGSETMRGSFLAPTIFDCLKASSITWQQAAKCHESFLPIVWAFFTTRPRSTEDLRSALLLESRPPSLAPGWMMLPFTSGITVASNEADVPLEEFMETLSQTVPEHTSKLTFFLLARFVEAVRGRYFNKKAIKNLLYAVESRRMQGVDSEWLNSSRSYAINSESESFDLLNTSLECLDDIAVEHGAFSEDGLVSGVRNYVVELRTRRDLPAA